jgi:hypothetical protein
MAWLGKVVILLSHILSKKAIVTIKNEVSEGVKYHTKTSFLACFLVGLVVVKRE